MFESVKHRVRYMDTRELKKSFKHLDSLKDPSFEDEVYRELCAEELDMRDREYIDWISLEVV